MGFIGNGIRVSPLLQEHAVFVGQLDCYARSSEILSRFCSVKLGNTQIFRLTDYYGGLLGREENYLERTLAPLASNERLYAEVDGSMLPTREDGWKEAKLGRVYKSGDNGGKEGGSGGNLPSQYHARLGDAKTFTEEMDVMLASYGQLGDRLVFISDGAAWIRTWIEERYPGAVSILDFFHASEHLHEFANRYFGEGEAASAWARGQTDLLKESLAEKVLLNIRALPGHEKKGGDKLINYYENNKGRMDYKYYRTIGAGIIGSGAIESAHRTVIQKRMKQAGQRWSIEGAQNMLNIRATEMSGKWVKIIDLVRNIGKIAA